MNQVDATDRAATQDTTEPPSLLTIILDTNPHAWALINDSLPLSKAVANLLVFINAHLAINPANRVAVLASHAERSAWLYPTPAPTSREEHSSNGGHASTQPPDDANKYRPFAQIEHAITTNLRRLMQSTTIASIQSTPATMVAGALTLALTYISKSTSSSTPQASAQMHFNYSDPSSVAGGNELSSANGRGTGNASMSSSPRILMLSVSGDLAEQYIPIMNAIFACQRLSIPIDILKLAGDTVFLQQAADATGGIYLPCTTPNAHAGLLQYLMFAFLPDMQARKHLILPGEGEGVDFRAACFCHRRVVDVGYVCSICLSIFCEPTLPDGACLTCGSKLALGDYGTRPAVVPKKKKKKKRIGDGVDTPGSGPGTPMAV